LSEEREEGKKKETKRRGKKQVGYIPPYRLLDVTGFWSAFKKKGEKKKEKEEEKKKKKKKITKKTKKN